MKSPAEVWNLLKQNTKKEWKTAFLSAVILGLLIHLPMMTRDIPNHDGLDSIYFDQNMITSGRWFLGSACGISSYYTLPWLIGLLAILYLGFASAALTELLEVKKTGAIVMISGLLVSFPAIASTFAYVFTMDGYMLALLLAVLSVLCVKKCKWGFLLGGACLALSLGIYQAYLPFAVLLCIYAILMIVMDNGSIKEKVLKSLRYLYMGIIGAVGYLAVLHVLLKIQGKELASYQGIDSMGAVEKTGLLETVLKMYTDFVSFTLKGNILINNVFSLVAVCGLVLVAAVVILQLVIKKKWWKNPWLYLLCGMLAVGLPIATNIVLIISPDVTYHSLMRYQWVMYPILLVAFVSGYMGDAQISIAEASGSSAESVTDTKKTGTQAWIEWAVLLTVGVLVWNFAVTDHIAYSNLQKRYEKTYAYCVRLLDRIEQTPGYYQGMPIAMIGVVGDASYPVTDVTGPVTSNLIGMTGDSLIYTGNNYELFIKHYLGASLNILPAEAMEEMYYDEAYREMGSFPAADSIKIIDGIMYIKTENVE